MLTTADHSSSRDVHAAPPLAAASTIVSLIVNRYWMYHPNTIIGFQRSVLRARGGASCTFGALAILVEAPGRKPSRV